MKKKSAAVVLYDGECGLCDWSVRFILKHERRPDLMFAALTSSFANKYTKHFSSDSIVMIHPELGVLEKSTALLTISDYLKAPWRWLKVFHIFPQNSRNHIYDLVARNRYRFNSTFFHCTLHHSPALRNRLIEK